MAAQKGLHRSLKLTHIGSVVILPRHDDIGHPMAKAASYCRSDVDSSAEIKPARGQHKRLSRTRAPNSLGGRRMRIEESRSGIA
jgi:hypothetical protein